MMRRDGGEGKLLVHGGDHQAHAALLVEPGALDGVPDGPQVVRLGRACPTRDTSSSGRSSDADVMNTLAAVLLAIV